MRYTKLNQDHLSVKKTKHRFTSMEKSRQGAEENLSSSTRQVLVLVPVYRMLLCKFWDFIRGKYNFVKFRKKVFSYIFFKLTYRITTVVLCKLDIN